tara:strand:- start:1863 stop:2144 length:282 start_codon:yes stop_codon:yes gene_type:complete
MRDQAIYNTHSNALYIKAEIAYDKNEIPVNLDEAKVQTEVDRLQAEYDALAYARARQAEYPDWGVQLNKIYDDGIDAWKTDMVDPIKAKFPKP